MKKNLNGFGSFDEEQFPSAVFQEGDYKDSFCYRLDGWWQKQRQIHKLREREKENMKSENWERLIKRY